jgi:tetratricopeptide (TPR) repeat protein
MGKNKSKHANSPNGENKLGQALSIEAKFHLVVGFFQNEKITNAKILLNEILLADPRHAESWFYSALIAEKKGSPLDAIRYLETALEIDPQNLKYLYTIGDFFYEQNYLEEGIKIFELVIKIQPQDYNGYYNLAGFLRKQGKYTQSLLNYHKVLELDEDNINAIYNIGDILLDTKNYENAVQYFQKVIDIQPNSDDALNNLGFLYLELDDVENAIECLNKALLINSSNFNALNNLGKAYEKKSLFQEAIKCFDGVIHLKPDYAEGYYNRGVVFDGLLRCEEAVLDYDKAISLKPNLVGAYWNKSLNLLLSGDLLNGWVLYEWRWKKDSFTHEKQTFYQPLWLGDENIQNKTILLHAEQGLGDTIQFCRYAKLVKKLGAIVLLVAPKPLLDLLRGLDGVDQLIESGQPLPAFDYHCPLMSLPLAFKTDLYSVPESPAFKINRQKINYWKNKLGIESNIDKKPRIGLVWNGGFRPNQPEVWGVNQRRNLPLDHLKILKNTGFEFVSLQKGEPAESEFRCKISEGWDGPDIKDYVAELQNFSDTAALVLNLDLVIAVDTSTAHLAASLGKTVWLLNRFDTCWRWLLDTEDSPWYPSMKIYRQPTHGDWEGVMQAVRQDLFKYLNNCKF